MATVKEIIRHFNKTLSECKSSLSAKHNYHISHYHSVTQSVLLKK